MKTPSRTITILLLFVALILLALGGNVYIRQKELPHFKVVRKNVLYRSGQPRGLGLSLLRRKHMRTLVNLRKPDADGNTAEAAYARGHKMTFISLPIGRTRKELDEAVTEFLRIMDKPENAPVLIHCSRGKERSGLLAAIYRIEFDGWSNQKALFEMYCLGVTPGTMPVVEQFVWNYVPRRDRGLNKEGLQKGPNKPIHWQE